ncbi:uncharacterized protein LOC128242913 isoform X2 [Mya arenaria]|uniref:uncharacterized protein LOC128242913 isoform X2 n=1 Tax=Mya arenaria TaxID=6604 RepID=UPI0022E66883|nr:uncharacterized protein LOC128242913 isoform X2 [Mya arenaria]
MEKMTDRMNARKYQFTKDADMERLLGSKKGLGTLDVAGEFRKNIPDLSTVTWKNEADIHVRAQQDKATCYISGLALLSPGLFLLADFDNYCANWWTSTPAPSRSSSSCQTSPGTYVCFLMTRQQLLSRIRP